MKDVFANEQPKNGDIYYYCPEIHIEEILAVLGQLLSSENFEIMKLYLEGYTYIEIADQLNMPVNTVGTRIHRSKKKLANYFKNP